MVCAKNQQNRKCSRAPSSTPVSEKQTIKLKKIFIIFPMKRSSTLFLFTTNHGATLQETLFCLKKKMFLIKNLTVLVLCCCYFETTKKLKKLRNWLILDLVFWIFFINITIGQPWAKIKGGGGERESRAFLGCASP